MNKTVNKAEIKNIVANATIAAETGYASPERCLEIMKGLGEPQVRRLTEEEAFATEPFKTSEWYDKEMLNHCARDPHNFAAKSPALLCHLVAKSAYTPELRAEIFAQDENRKCKMITHIIYLVPDKKYAKLHDAAMAEQNQFPISDFWEHEITSDEAVRITKEELEGMMEYDNYCESSQEQYHIVRKRELLWMFIEDYNFLDDPEEFEGIDEFSDVEDLEDREDFSAIYAKSLEIYKDHYALRDLAQRRSGLITHYINIICDEDYYRIMG